MKRRSWIRIAALCMSAVMAVTPVSASAALLKRGSRGSEVKVVQTTLKELGYFTYPKATGYYGKITEKAVKQFQKDNGINPNGIIGDLTMRALKENESKTAENSTASAKVLAVSTENAAKYIGDFDWFKEVRDKIWDRGEDALVTDIDTGKSFMVKRTYGTNHADIEPLTKEDSKIIKEIWGGWSWKRRAVIVQVGDYTLAGSMAAMPHAGLDKVREGKYVSGRSQGYGYGYNFDAVKNNGANGHMDLHFKNSRTHNTNSVKKQHQDMVKKAAAYLKKMYN